MLKGLYFLIKDLAKTKALLNLASSKIYDLVNKVLFILRYCPVGIKGRLFTIIKMI